MKKLFDIKYNNKNFTIFLSSNKRKVFLEKDETGKYEYPLFEDFKVLNSIYNIHNPFIFYDKNIFFKEKVRLASGILAVVVAATAIKGLVNIKYQVSDNEVNLVYDDTNLGNTQVFSNTKYLDEILGYTSVTKEEIYKAIDDNTNLDKYYKIFAKSLVNKYLEEVPNADLRIFYENIKTLKIVEIDDPAILGDKIAGNYDTFNNQINLINGALINTIYHELAHVTQEFYVGSEQGVIFRYTDNSALNEAMNNKIVSLFTLPTSYQSEGLLLDYLLLFVDYSLEDYNKYGIDELINRLKEKYPDIDFDYISEFINTLSDTQKTLGYDISITNSREYLDELFKLCLKNVNLNNPYKSLTNFIKILENNDELINAYLDKYNNYLKDLSCENIITKEELNSINKLYKDYEYVTINDNQPYLCGVIDSKLSLLNYYGNTPISMDDMIYINNLDTYIKINYLNYKDIYGTQEFWINMVNDNKLIKDYMYKKIPIYNNGEFLSEEYLQDLEVGISKDNGNIKFELFKTSDMIDLQNYVARIPLLDYLKLYNFNDKLELSYVFNIAYLKGVEERLNLFDDVVINNNDILVMSNCKLHITDDDTFYSLDLCRVYKYGIMSIPFVNIQLDISWDGDDYFFTDLYTIFNYYNILDENKDIYAFSREELKELVTKYINETVLNKETHLSR